MNIYCLILINDNSVVKSGEENFIFHRVSNFLTDRFLRKIPTRLVTDPPPIFHQRIIMYEEDFGIGYVRVKASHFSRTKIHVGCD